MNNLLKIFLIFNLVSSVAPNNFSQPLPETELKMGQNSSQIDEGERRKPDFPYLHGGMKVTGLSWVGNLPDQRSCTLSFPVYRTDDKTLGFLTSYLCARDVIFVNGDEAGSIDQPYNLLSDPGLDYAFVEPISDYWLDEVSQKVDYSLCVSSGRGIVDVDKPLPIIPTPSSNLSVGDKVYAHGGDSGMVQGVILETGVKLSVQNPKSEDPFYLYDVVKVQMSKIYSGGNLGAPVYIPLPVPDSDQFVASPAGQVVEMRDWDLKTGGQDIWYYIPLDRILDDSKLTIASGDLSYLLPPNNTESSNDYLTDDLVSGTNDSDINNLVRRQPQHQTVYTHSGLRAWMFRYSGNTLTPVDGNNAKKCTLGFAVRKVRGGNRFDHGFLTLGSCMHGTSLGTPTDRNDVYYTPNQEWVKEEAIRLGAISSLKYDPANGLNYAILRLRPNDDQRTLWDDDVSADTPVMWGDEEQFAATYNQARRPNNINIGGELCWWGSASGHMCGVVIDDRTTLKKLNPWKWPIYVELVIPLVIAGNPVPVNLQWSPEDTFQNLIKVRLDGNYQPQAENSKNDYGAPVYYPYFDGYGRGRQIAHVQPVGILLDYVLEEHETINYQCMRVWYMYCISVYRILHDSEFEGQYLQLIGEDFA